MSKETKDFLQGALTIAIFVVLIVGILWGLVALFNYRDSLVPQNELGWYARCDEHLWTAEPRSWSIIRIMNSKELAEYCPGE